MKNDPTKKEMSADEFISKIDNFHDKNRQLGEAMQDISASYTKYLDERNIGNKNDIGNILSDQYGFLLFDTKEEMVLHYNLTVGDDGPTKLNKYNGKLGVYALTCNNDGELQTENT